MTQSNEWLARSSLLGKANTQAQDICDRYYELMDLTPLSFPAALSACTIETMKSLYFEACTIETLAYPPWISQRKLRSLPLHFGFPGWGCHYWEWQGLCFLAVIDPDGLPWSCCSRQMNALYLSHHCNNFCYQQLRRSMMSVECLTLYRSKWITSQILEEIGKIGNAEVLEQYSKNYSNAFIQ